MAALPFLRFMDIAYRSSAVEPFRFPGLMWVDGTIVLLERGEFALPTAPRQWGSALQELHCPLPPGTEAVHCSELHCPLPPGSEAVRCRNCTVPCPQAVRQCVAGVALPTAPG